MDKFMRKYSVWLTTVLGIAAVIFLVVTWNSAPVLQTLVAFYLIALTCHE